MAINDELLDQLIAGYKKPEDLIGENGLLKELAKRLLERAMQAEMTDHLGYAKSEPSGKNTGNSRNGSYKRNVKGDRFVFPLFKGHNNSSVPLFLFLATS